MQAVDRAQALAPAGWPTPGAPAIVSLRGLAWARTWPVLAAVALGAATVASRLPLRGRYLFNWDSLQFALGMQRFDLAAHRPHPPGYVGYIYLGRLLTHLTGAGAESVLTVISITGEAATVAGLYLLARRFFGEFAGIAAALLMLTSPLYWVYGETALTYGLEPGLALLAFWLLWRATRHQGRGLVTAAVVIGLEGAIRQSSELFLVLPLAVLAVVALRRGEPAARRRVARAVAALIGATALWALPLIVLSGGLPDYLRSSAELGSRVTASSALWRAGLAGLNLNSGAVLNGLLLSLGPFLPLVVAVGLMRLAGARGSSPAPSRRTPVLAILCLAPALVTYLVIHIGQLAYVLFGVPLLLLFAGPVLTRLTTLVLPGRELAGRWVRAGTLAACVIANVVVFAVPENSLAQQVKARDEHVAALTAAVRWRDPASTVLVTDPEGPSSYRTAMYYLPEFDVIAVGRDSRGRAGEMFSNRPGAPEYDISRFEHAGPLRLPVNGLVLILDDAVLGSIGDRIRLETSTYGPGAADRMYFTQLSSADPAVASGGLIYLRGSDCPCRDPLRDPEATRHGQPT